MMSQVYLLVALIVLAYTALITISSNKKHKTKRISKAASLAFILVMAGIFLRENQILSYTLIGLGLLLSLWDIKNKV